MLDVLLLSDDEVHYAGYEAAFVPDALSALPSSEPDSLEATASEAGTCSLLHVQEVASQVWHHASPDLIAIRKWVVMV